MTEPLLTRRRILDALGRLADHLREDGIVGEVFLVGGAVMVMEHEARRGTADLVAFDFEPHEAIEGAAARVAQELSLPRSWLHQQASAYVPLGAEWHRSDVFDHPNLRVYAIAPRQLLAMKILAGRPRDGEDIVTLCRLLDITDPVDALAVAAEVFPSEAVPDRKAAFVRDLLPPGNRP